MNIRKAKAEDIDEIMKIYAVAKAYMDNNGNATQWTGGYPGRELIIDDINKGNSYVGENKDGELCCVFAFIIGKDPTYTIIENGKWLNNEPYGTIHRIASNAKEHRVLERSVEYCSKLTDNIRIDTHENNKTMQHLLRKTGFTYCGIIYLENGEARLAYQLSCL